MRSRDLLTRPSEPNDRISLQARGDCLEASVDAAWLVGPVQDRLRGLGGKPPLVLDAVRTLDQISRIRGELTVLHVHLEASESILRGRYLERSRDAGHDESRSIPSWDEATANRTEREVRHLATVADLRLDTDDSSPATIVERVLRAIPRLRAQ